jgi:Zn-dependent peptidase ImmA (M78 family)/DNA-binding XRE family transcriptional regulator
MDTQFAERLKSARLMKGYSLQDLEDSLNRKVSRQALHKYEKGEMTPDSEMLGHLCEVLDVRPDFFYSKSEITFGDIEFRNLKKLPVKEEHRIIEQTKYYLSRYLELENILGLDSNFVNPLDGSPQINDHVGVEEAARKVREKWEMGNGPIASVYALLEDMNIKVIEIEAGEEYDGMQTVVNGTVPVIVINKLKVRKPDRRRFTALHELGHLILPIKHLPEKQKETLCHLFAGAMLIPPDHLIRELGGPKRLRLSMQELGAIKKEYGISIQALVMRAKALNIISDNYCGVFFAMLKSMGWKTDEPIDYDGHESGSRFDQLIYRALTEELISVSKAASLKNQKLAEFKAKSAFFQ